jgi:hypothetical protein
MSPDDAGVLIDQLRAADITLTCDPATRAIRTSDSRVAVVAAGQRR